MGGCCGSIAGANTAGGPGVTAAPGVARARVVLTGVVLTAPGVAGGGPAGGDGVVIDIFVDCCVRGLAPMSPDRPDSSDGPSCFLWSRGSFSGSRFPELSLVLSTLLQRSAVPVRSGSVLVLYNQSKMLG